ncbi:MAG: hypothetical protein GEEBNDBF_00434 [bacterium]|nr:hypothetical protein [bacterium]
MRLMMICTAIAALCFTSGCLASLPVKIKSAPSDAPAKVKELAGGVTLITDDKWDVEVIQASNTFPVVVDMYADWCGPCRKLSPILEEISHENKRVKFVKINTDDSSKGKSLGVGSIPTLIVYKNGTEVKRIVGLRPKDALVSEFASL